MNATTVALLACIDWDRSAFPDRLFRDNGTQFTAEEAELVGAATYEEIAACRDHLRTLQEFAEEQFRLADRLTQLTAPYFAVPGVVTMGDAEALMTEAERAEIAEIAAVIAPDGNLVISTTSQSP